jgi:hypothetical protein
VIYNELDLRFSTSHIWAFYHPLSVIRENYRGATIQATLGRNPMIRNKREPRNSLSLILEIHNGCFLN